MLDKQQEEARSGERASDADGNDQVVRPATAWHPLFYGLMDEGAPPDHLRLFSRDRRQNPEGVRWLNARYGTRTIMEKLRELEGYEDILDIIKSMHGPEELLRGLPPDKLLKNLTPEQRLAGLPPEEVLRHYKPEERLAGLPPQAILQLLRHLGERGEFEGKLPAAVLEALRKATNGTP